MGNYEVYRKFVGITLETERTTVAVADDKRKIATIEKLTVKERSLINMPVAVIRYQYDNHLGSASLELDATGQIISYEEFHPFGTTSYRSGTNETEVSLKRYKYIGKERDEETGLYYYGARYYAAWIGRFVSVDPLAHRSPDWSPYRSFFCNPLNYIDYNGKYELPAYIIKNYPLFTSYLKNNIRNDVMGSDIIINAFAKNTAADNPNGIGNLTREELNKAVTWGSGPMIIIRDDPGGMEGAEGYYNSSKGQIELSSKRVADLERILASDTSEDNKLNHLLAVYITLLHETVHYGDYLDGIRQDGGEPGIDFENDVWLGKEINIGDEVMFFQYFSGDKYNPIEIQEVINEKSKTEDGLKTLPTLPKYKK